MAEATAKGACSPPTKKQRTDDCSDAVDSTTDQGCVGDRDPHFLTSFKDFEVVRILNNDEEHKSVVVECQIKGKEGVAVAQLQKLPFNAQKLGDILSSGTTLKTLFQNDIYYNKTALVPPDLNEMKATIIYPAEEKHILRYEKQPSSFIQETPQLYREVTKRFIETSSLGKEVPHRRKRKRKRKIKHMMMKVLVSLERTLDIHKCFTHNHQHETEENNKTNSMVSPQPQMNEDNRQMQNSHILPDHQRAEEKSNTQLQWIYNILDHKKEVDRIVFEDPDPDTGFILLPDLKWTGEQMEDLYLQAIVRRRDITCLRELDASHLPLLKNLLEKGSAAIKEKYGIPAHKLRVYLHYQPSFYHLHVHFSALSFEAPGTWAGKAHLLSSVISNIETCSDHYQKVTLPYTLKDNAPLSAMFKAHGYFSE
uniref:m7GpppX diphosphatase n=1 Tax=Scylla olivacea TaxID=85551 RepID=A0A0P4WE53_SCYOL